ncbi:DNA-binding transcriptional regulator GbsR (MarR family) [Paenibacillus phyllosphaerae]|uniref:HTH-type transcriptional regulator n=1 Tax=Paenibacillus phyllosphaerae TaxID=274593 RepID=A0A7W5FPJ0_9BACL|nr:transcriptional regulator [Paenibacillus phyllosphaerae]MBB3112406.1 DNA-binding transcriptional regulator GbsR (MarR family) [Paenibacillus phyllosphaerae]
MKRPTEAGGEAAPARRGELRAKVIDAIAQTMDLYGANYSFGQLYGIMFFEDKPMTLEDMKSHMNMSKSNMSYAIRSLLGSQMVVKLEEKQDRKDLYVAETDFFQAFRNFFTMKLQREIDIMTAAIDDVIQELSEMALAEETDEEERRLCLNDLHKLRHSIGYYEWMQRFVDRLQAGDLFEHEGKSRP